jgi:drug/metabolite transporter (DMT)-like permease
MQGDLLQAILDVIFGGMLLYLSPILFMLGVLLFGEKLIDLIIDTLSDKRKRYR